MKTVTEIVEQLLKDKAITVEDAVVLLKAEMNFNYYPVFPTPIYPMYPTYDYNTNPYTNPPFIYTTGDLTITN